MSPPAIRAVLSIPPDAKRTTDTLFELVPGVPLTQEVRQELNNRTIACAKEKKWTFVHVVRTRAVRKNGMKETKVDHEMQL